MAEKQSTKMNSSELKVTSWGDLKNSQDDPINEKLNTLVNLISSINTRLEIIEKYLIPVKEEATIINQELKEELIDTKKHSNTLTNIVESMIISKEVSDVSSNQLTDGGGSGDESSKLENLSFNEVLDLFTIPFITTQYGIELENELDFRLFDSFMDNLKGFIKSKFQMSDDKKRIITHNLKQFFGLSTYRGILSRFEINTDEELRIAQIKAQTISEESEEDFIYRWCAMVVFQESFKIYNDKCKNNIMTLFQKLFNFSLIELIDEEISEKGNTCKTVKFKLQYENVLEDIWSYLQIERECTYYKSRRCKFSGSHGIFTHY